MLCGTWKSCMPIRVASAGQQVAERNVAPLGAELAWTDTRLVRECSNGNEDAWDALIEKYKRLIYSIPVKYGFNPDDANDIFQAVCLELLSELPKLRKPKALPKWLIQVASHKCFHRKPSRFFAKRKMSRNFKTRSRRWLLVAVSSSRCFFSSNPRGPIKMWPLVSGSPPARLASSASGVSSDCAKS